jgi:hypothetical protein
MYRPAPAAVLAVCLLMTSAIVSAQPNPGSSARALKYLGTFAATVLGGATTKVSADYLASWMKRALPQPASTQPSDLGNREYGYRFTLQWTDPADPAVTYTGMLTMLGATGQFRVSVFSHGQRTAVVAQEMSARPARDGSNAVELWPRAATVEQGAAGFEYFPDTFWLVPMPNGQWTIKDTCDARRCAPVAAVSAELLAAR